jgi:hypothetical protein
MKSAFLQVAGRRLGLTVRSEDPFMKSTRLRIEARIARACHSRNDRDQEKQQGLKPV